MGESRSSHRKSAHQGLSPRRARDGADGRAPGSRLAAPVPAAVEALRRGREALIELDGHLDEALVWLRSPGSRLDRALPDRLGRSARQAGEALAAAFVPSHALF